MNYSRNDTFQYGLNEVLPRKLTNHTMRSTDMNRVPRDKPNENKQDDNEDWEDDETSDDEETPPNNKSKNSKKKKLK